MSGAVPSTYSGDPEVMDDTNKPTVNLHRDGQSKPHPAFATHVPLEFGPGAGKQMVRGHTRGGKAISPHFRGKPDTSGNASDPMAPHTNAEPAELYKGKAGV